MTPKVERLKQLGLTAVAEQITQELSLREKLAIAYEHYRYLTPEKVVAFNDKLKKETKQDEGKNPWGQITSYKRTRLTSLNQYGKVPPDAVLDALEAAHAHKCFDEFQVMDLESHREVPDPILFGKIAGCEDLFYIAQWDTDVKIEDILKDHEGWRFLEKS